MKSKLYFWSLIATSALATTLQAADVDSFLIVKGQQFRQTNAAAPVQITAEEPFQAHAAVMPTGSGSITGVTLRLPNSQVVTLDQDGDGSFNGGASFTTKPQLDAQIGIGTYNFVIQTLNDGTNRPAIALPTDNYPSTPRILNWSDAQEVERTADFPLSFFAFTNGTVNDFVVFSVALTNESDLFSTPGFLETNALNGTATSAILPAGTLEANTTYEGRVLFVKRTTTNTNSIPGAVGFAGYYKETVFPVVTLPDETGPGRIQLGASIFSVSEASPTELLVPIYRTSTSLTGAVSVTLTISDGTAHSEVDYHVNNLVSVVDFADGMGYAGISVIPINNSLLDGNRTFTFSLSNPTDGAVLGSRSNAVVTVLDDEVAAAGRFQFNPVTYAPTEVSKQALLTVARVGGSSGVASINFYTTNGSALGGLDFTPTNGTLIFAAGQLTRQIVVPIIEDGLDETNETFQVILDAPAGNAALGSNLTATVTITDNDDGGVINFKSTSFTTNENAAAAIITLVRTLGLASNVTVTCETQDGLTNGATAGQDYQNTHVVVTFNTNETTKTFTIPLQDDANAELNETVLIRMLNPTGGARLGNLTNAILTLRDDESSFTFTNANYTVSEAGPVLTVNVIRNGALITTGMVDFATSDISAVSTNDYRGTNGTFTFPPGVGFRTLSLPIVNDTGVEDNETFLIHLSHPQGGAQLGVLTNTTVTITNNDFGGVISFTATNFPALETGGNASITISRVGGTASGVSVKFSTADITATMGLDYSNTLRTVTFGAGELSKTVLVPILNDTLDEANETFLVSLSNPQGGGSLGVRSNATVTIADNDTAGLVAFRAATFSTNEFGTFALITVARSGGAASDVTVDFATENGTALAGSDYFATNGTLVFGSNQSSRTFLVPLTNDFEFETNETVLLHLTNPTGGARLGAISNATLTILDDESTLTFTNASYTVSEAGPVLNVNVIRTGARITPVTVDFNTVDNSAISTNDYRGTNGTLTFPPGVGFRTLSIPIVNDTVVEDSETFFINLTNVLGGAQLGAMTNITATITNNDVAGTISFSLTNFAALESVGSAPIVINRSGGSASSVSVLLTISDGTAAAGLDYSNATQTVTFNANELSKTVLVPVSKDTLDETNETVLLSLSNPQGGGSLGVRSNATLTITDDDTGGVIAFNAAAYTTNENSGFALITVLRSGGAASGVTVDFATHDGVAADGSDYTATNGTLVFGSNELSKTFQVMITDDFLPEGNEPLSLTLSHATGGATLGAISNATLTIRDDESSVSFTNAAYEVTEAGLSVSVNVIRSGALITPVTVGFSTVDGSAVSPGDYRGTNGTLIFPANTAMRTLTIPIVNDTIVEGNEGFNLFLHSPSNGLQLGTLTNSTVTISDNDLGGIINFSFAQYVTNENRNATITITRSGGAASGVSVLFATQDGSATDGLDYTGVSQTVTFGAGQTSTNVVVPITNDALDEANETVQLSLGNVLGGASLNFPTNATLTINDDDSGGVFRFGAQNYVTNENAGAFLVNIVRSSGLASNVTVSFFTQDGTATTAQPDYTSTNGTLSFGAGETNKFITVPINNDNAPEGSETLSVVLTNATGGAVVSPTNTTGLTIIDDESSVSFTNATYTVSEAGPSLSITVVRSGALGTAVSVGYTTINGTAIDTVDYTATNATLNFPANTAVRTIVIPIKEDFTIEGTENFVVQFSNPQGGVQLGTVTNAMVNITDNDFAGVIKFSAASYSGNEGSSASIIIQRTGGLGSGVTVPFYLINGTAGNGDYAHVDQIVTFNGGESNKTISVALTTDIATEGTETVNLGLGSPTGGATLGSPSTAVLSITEAPPANCPNITFNLGAQGMKATAGGGAFTASIVSGGLAGGVLSITAISFGTTTKSVDIVLGDIPPGTTGTFPLSSGSDFGAYSVSVINTGTLCSDTKTYNSAFPGSGCIKIVEWNTATKVFKATFTFSNQGASSMRTCQPPTAPVPGPTPTDHPLVAGGQVWVNYN